MASPFQDSFSGNESRHKTLLAPWRLSWVALVLLALYATTVLSAALPLLLTDPAWQLRLYNALVNASAFPLVGVGLLHLAAELDPRSETLARRAGFFKRLMVPVALGFLLLIPFQGYLIWQQSNTAASGQTTQLARQERTLASLRQAVQQADSVGELQRRLSVLQGPNLGPAEQALPLNQLKPLLMVALEQADRSLQRRRAELPKADPLNLIALALRNGVACLALAIGFAALGQRRRSPGPLLMEWQNGLQRLLTWRPWRGGSRTRGTQQQVASYVEQLSRTDSENTPR